MKWGMLTVAAVTILIVACNTKSADDIKKETNDIIRNSQQDNDELINSLYRGGQPGKITVKGIVVKMSNTQAQLDERLKVEQIGGKANQGESRVMILEKNKAFLSEAVDQNEFLTASASEKYINIGCGKLDQAETENLSEEQITDLKDAAVPLVAKKIFICGSQLNAYSFLTILAEQLVLKDASIKVSSVVGSISVSAMKLSLSGVSSIETQGVDLAVSVLEAPPIEFSVSEAVDGEGSLLLRSVGGNCVQKGNKQPDKK